MTSRMQSLISEAVTGLTLGISAKSCYLLATCPVSLNPHERGRDNQPTPCKYTLSLPRRRLAPPRTDYRDCSWTGSSAPRSPAAEAHSPLDKLCRRSASVGPQRNVDAQRVCTTCPCTSACMLSTQRCRRDNSTATSCRSCSYSQCRQSRCRWKALLDMESGLRLLHCLVRFGSFDFALDGVKCHLI